MMTTGTLSVPSKTNSFPWWGSRQRHRQIPFSPCISSAASRIPAIGGFGFFGPPDGVGQVEFGYGLVASARGLGLATEAVRRALEVATEHGALSAVAVTDIHNRPSQRVLEKAGVLETSRDESTIYFSCLLV